MRGTSKLLRVGMNVALAILIATGCSPEIRALGANFNRIRSPAKTEISDFRWLISTQSFGTLNQNAASPNAVLSLKNFSTSGATFCSGLSLANSVDFTLVSETCGTADIPPLGGCTATVRANPTLLGNLETDLTQTCIVAGQPVSATSRLSVNSVAPALAWSPLTSNFGSVTVGANSGGALFFLTNSGSGSASGCAAPILSNTIDFSVVSDGCSTSNLASGGGSCTVAIQGNPASSGIKTATLSRTCTVGGTATTTSNGITVSGVAPASLAWNPLTYSFGSISAGANSANQNFVLTNSGDASATGCSAPTLSNSTDFSIQSDGCASANLGGSATCTVAVRANPASSGAKTTTLSRVCTVGGTVTTTTNQITVTGVNPVSLDWTPLTHSFGNIVTGSNSANQTFTLTNSGGVDASTCSAPTLSNTTDFTIATDGCAVADVTSGGGTCTVAVRANPTTTGAKTATLSRTCSVGGTVTTTTNGITTTGTYPNIAVSPLTYSFGSIAIGVQSSTQVFTFTNSGTANATGCSSATLGGTHAGDFAITANGCGTADLAASGGTCTVTVRAQPTVPGARTATLSRACTVGNTASTTANGISVTGTTSAFTNNWPFDFNTTSSYTYDSTKLDFTGGVCRLTPTDQTDDDNTSSGFAGGTLAGATWDAGNGYVRLSQTGTPTNNSELDSSWTPKYSSIIAYWKLNGSGSISSGTGVIPATIGPNGDSPSTGVMSYVTGKLFQGVQFTRTANDCLNLPKNSVTSLNAATRTSWTIHSWINVPSLTGQYPTIYGYGSWGVTLGYQPSTGKIESWVNFTNVLRSPNPVTLATWNQVDLTFDGTTRKIYLNGQMVASDTPGSISTDSSTSNAAIGCVSAQGAGGAFWGKIDDVALWDGALTASEIQLIYSRQSGAYSGTLISRVMDAYATAQSWTSLSWIPTLPFLKALPDFASGAIQNESSTDYSSLVGSTGSTGADDLMSGIVGLWHLDEAAGTTGAGSVKDSSGQGSNGAPSGGVSFGDNGKLNTGATLNGSTGFLNLGNVLNFTSSAFTLSTWVYLKALTTNDVAQGPVLFYKGGYNTNGYYLQVQSGGYISFTTSQASAAQLTSAPDGTITANKWTHILITRSGASVKIYVDGVNRTTTSGTHLNPASSSDSFVLGNYGSGGSIFTNGTYDEVAAWSRALDPKEVLQFYRRGANRVKYQVRNCTAADCSDDSTGANWKGPDGSNQTYFSELDNRVTQGNPSSGAVKATLPMMTFSNFTNPISTSRYFQYRTILESDDTGTGCNYGSGATWCSPELKSVSVAPIHYDSTNASIYGNNGVGFWDLATFAETLGSGGCPGGTGYNLSLDKSTWYYWSGTAWVTANGTATQSNSATVISTNASTFGSSIGRGTIYFKAYLKSSGSQACELDNVQATGTQ